MFALCSSRFLTSGFGRRPNINKGRRLKTITARNEKADHMSKLKWWQWCLVIFIGLPFIGATISAITGGQSIETERGKKYEPANAEFKLIAGEGIFAMTFNPKADPDKLPEIARRHCGSRDFCNVLGWTDPAFAAKGFPMTERETKSVKFQYTVNRHSGLEQELWDCTKWAKQGKDSCL